MTSRSGSPRCSADAMRGSDPRTRLAARLRRRPPALYGLLDVGLTPLHSIPGLAARLADAGVEILQLRGKGLGSSEVFDLTRAVLAELGSREIPLIVNDRADVALAGGAAGVHLGLEDLPALEARRLLGPGAIVGVTAHTPAELSAVDPSVADYVGYGAVFETGTRAEAVVCGPEALTAAVAASTLPVVAIGGIAPGNVEALRGSGVSAVAAAASLVSARTSPGAVEEFLRVLADW
jgi:thiamine-phosphate pyrophosphorylase